MVLHESARAQRLLPGAAVIARIRRLFVLALIASFALAASPISAKRGPATDPPPTGMLAA